MRLLNPPELGVEDPPCKSLQNALQTARDKMRPNGTQKCALLGRRYSGYFRLRFNHGEEFYMRRTLILHAASCKALQICATPCSRKM